MKRVQIIVFGSIIVALIAGGLYFMRSQEPISVSPTPTWIDLPLQVESIAGDDIQSGTSLTIVLTINCQLSSLQPGCGADPVFASLSDCSWQNDRMRFVNHKVFNSGYEEARWDLNVWGDGPLWLSIADHLPAACTSDLTNTRKYVGSINVSYREGID